MSTALTWQIVSEDLDGTLALGQQVGRSLRGGEVIELVSDLGGGKTSFVKGVAKGFGSEDIVRSPSFTISNTYQAGDRYLYHLDFYRLSDAGIMGNELAEMLADAQASVCIEWGDIVEDILPADRLTIHIEALGETKRQLTFTYPESLSYLIAEAKKI